MLTVTDTAIANLAQILKQQGAPEDVAVRFVYETKGIALRHDSERPGDKTYQHEGRTVLLLDAQVSQLLAEDTLDIEGEKLVLNRPRDGE
jgi:hypothetical protein